MLDQRKAYDAVLQDLADRKEWEERQRVWYQMRHTGIPRRNKPFPGAANLHYPLADSHIGKLVPFYFAQVYSSDLLASFTARTAEAEPLTRDAAVWFDWILNNRSNWFEEILATVDAMLMAGHCPLKVGVSKGRIRFDAIEPIYFVTPSTTMDLESADRWCHILQFSEDGYRANKNYRQDDDLIKRLKGRADDSRASEKFTREGLTYGEAEQIVLWEVYQRTPDGIVVHTISPNLPQEEIRAPFKLGPEYGATGGFVLFPVEHKDKGYYASRGIVERVAPFETYLCRLWNEKADAMAFLNRPIFTSENPLQNPAEIRFRPGEYVPNNLRSVPMGSPPIDIDNEMMQVRSLSEYTVAMPDYGIGSSETGKDKRTATEVQAIGSLMGVSIDLKARIFRRALGKAYRIAWELARKHLQTELQIYVRGRALAVNPATLQATFEIEPEGSPDGWNKEQRVQRAYQRIQLFGQSPFVNQPELVRDALAEDSPVLAERVFKDPQQQQQDALVAQARAIAEVGLNYRGQGGADPAAGQILMGALQQRLQALQQMNPQAAQQLQQELMQFEQQVQQGQPQSQPPAA